MVTVSIKANTVDKIKRLNSLASKQSFEIDVTSMRYVVDAKSIMGLFSIDMSKAVKLQIHTDEEQCKQFVEDISDLVVQ